MISIGAVSVVVVVVVVVSVVVCSTVDSVVGSEAGVCFTVGAVSEV